MTDRYTDLRDLLDLTQTNVFNRDDVRALLADYDRMRDALYGAATSLNTIATLAGSKDDYMEDMFQVRGYAHNRARVARAALAQEG